MLYEAKKLADNGIPGWSVRIVNPYTGKTYPNVFAANTAEGWLELYVMDPTSKDSSPLGIMVNRKARQLMTARAYVSFDVVNRLDDRLLHSVRWPLGEGELKVKDFNVDTK